MGMGTDGIPTIDNITETIEIFGYPTNNIPDNRLFKLLNLIEISPNLLKLCFFSLYRIEEKRFEKSRIVPPLLLFRLTR